MSTLQTFHFPVFYTQSVCSRPETGQGLYHDSSTTGDLYAMPDKGNKRRAPPQPEMATYQDPNTIQRQHAPTGDLYAIPEKKPVYSQVNKDLKVL